MMNIVIFLLFEKRPAEPLKKNKEHKSFVAYPKKYVNYLFYIIISTGYNLTSNYSGRDIYLYICRDNI